MEQMKIEYFQPDLSSNTQTFSKTLVEIYVFVPQNLQIKSQTSLSIVLKSYDFISLGPSNFPMRSPTEFQ